MDDCITYMQKGSVFFDGLTQSSDFNCEMNENTRDIKIDTILTVLYDVIVSCRFYDVGHLAFDGAL